MTTADRPAIAAHAAAKVSSDEFRPSIEAAFEVIRDIKEYQDMTALIMYKRGARVHSRDDELEMTAGDLADVILYALCTGFAFGDDFGQSRFADGLLIGEPK